MLFSFFRRKTKVENITERYWLYKDHIFKEFKEELSEADLIFKYYCFFKKSMYVLWLEQDPYGKTGNKVMYLGVLGEASENGDRIPVYRLEDDYRMLNAIIELKKKIGTC